MESKPELKEEKIKIELKPENYGNSNNIKMHGNEKELVV